MTPLQQKNVIAEAMTWLNTPFHHEARVKGEGVDCANFLIGVFAGVGLIEDFTPEHYTRDFMLHKSEERFRREIERFADPVDEFQPGDIVLMRYGRCGSHGAMLIDGDRLIHSYVRRGVKIASIVEFESLFDGFYRVRSWAD